MKKSKYILNITLSIMTMMFAMDTFARGGGGSDSPDRIGRISGERITYGYRFQPRSRHLSAISPRAPRPLVNMNREGFRKQKRQNRKQCISSCIESFGAYYDVANALSPWGLVGGTTFIITDVLGDYSEDSLRRRGNTNLWGGNRGSGTWFIRAANLVRVFNAASLIGGGIGFLGQQGMEAYCKRKKCKKA